jgi:hypothetical protein
MYVSLLLNMFNAILISLLATAALLVTPARAEIEIEVVQLVQGTVRAQLAAFAADDSEQAFSYAAPNIRALFQTPENFMAMVKESYPVVYRPANFSFLKPRVEDGVVLQPVQMLDSNGRSWIAFYALVSHASGKWLISSCVLKREIATEV